MKNLLLVAGFILLPLVALASHSEPAKGKKVQFALVDGYSVCGSPNTATQSNGTPACSPPLSSAFFGCGFLPIGSGQFTLQTVGSAQQGTQDVKLKVTANGLNQSCDQLFVLLSYRTTTDDCPQGSCTTVDSDAIISGASCIVANGQCKIDTTLSAAAPGLFANGKNTGIEIYGCGLSTLLPLFDRSFSCGLLFK